MRYTTLFPSATGSFYRVSILTLLPHPASNQGDSDNFSKQSPISVTRSSFIPTRKSFESHFGPPKT